MAILTVKRKKYEDKDAFKSTVSYILYPEKTKGYFGGWGVNPDTASLEMEVVNNTSRLPNGNKLRHIILAFEPKDQVTPEKALDVARDMAEYYGNEYQTVYAVHLNTGKIHIHMIVSMTSYRTGKRYHGEKWDFYGFKDHASNVLRRHNLVHIVRQVKGL